MSRIQIAEATIVVNFEDGHSCIFTISAEGRISPSPRSYCSAEHWAIAAKSLVSKGLKPPEKDASARTLDGGICWGCWGNDSPDPTNSVFADPDRIYATQ